MPRADVTRQRFAFALMAASGFAGLGYQIVWTQQCALWMGHEAAAVLAVVAAFFGGLAIGALAFGPRIERSARPVRWYAACEGAIPIWSMVLAVVMAPVSNWLLGITGAQPTPGWQWTVAFLGTFLLLLPATVAMGATLPAMERVTAALRGDARSIAGLYAANTLGAVIGVLAVAFWLVPVVGLTAAAGVCAALNLLCALAARVLFSESAPGPQTTALPAGRRVMLLLAATGLLGIGYEVVVVRVLSQVTEATVYTFAMLLAVYLAGTAIGAAGYQRWLARRGDQALLGDRLLGLLAVACLLGTGSLWAAEILRDALLGWLGAGVATSIAAEAALAFTAFGLPTLTMGALFSHLGNRARAGGISFGHALAVNTLGAAFAPLLFGVLLVPVVGPKVALVLIAVGYLALTAPRGWLRPIIWVPAGAAAALIVLAPPLAFIDVPEGGRVVIYREGAMAAVSVVEDAEGVSRLRINNRQQEGSSATLPFDARQALLPLLLQPAPQRALFLGLGTGMTASSAAEDPTLQVDAVELLPEVIAASAHFTRVFAGGVANPRLHLIPADARRFVRTTSQHYDLIVADNFHPARSGSGTLYTVEHFQAVQSRLAPGGLFCQWLPLHQLDVDTVRSIVQSFLAVYPSGTAILASNSLETPVLGLVGRNGGKPFSLRGMRERLATTALPQHLPDYGIADEFAVLGSFVAGPRSLAAFAGAAPLNTDDHPVVAYRAPRITYAPDSLPRDRLMTLLGEFKIAPEDVIDSSTDAPSSDRLAAYWAARDRFIAVGRGVRPSADLGRMVAQVREPLLEVLRISPDFRPAYDPLLGMATALARTDVPAARSLLTALVQVQPARPEAAQMLRRLGATPP